MSNVKKGYYQNLSFSIVKDILHFSLTNVPPKSFRVSSGKVSKDKRYIEAVEYSTSTFGDRFVSKVVTEKGCDHCGMEDSCYFDFAGLGEEPVFVCLACGNMSTKGLHG